MSHAFEISQAKISKVAGIRHSKLDSLLQPRKLVKLDCSISIESVQSLIEGLATPDEDNVEGCPVNDDRTDLFR